MNGCCSGRVEHRLAATSVEDDQERRQCQGQGDQAANGQVMLTPRFDPLSFLTSFLFLQKRLG